MTAAPADAPEQFVLRAARYGKSAVYEDGLIVEWVRDTSLDTNEPFDMTGMTGTYEEVALVAVNLNETQKASGAWTYLYWPDRVDAKPPAGVHPRVANELESI